MGNAGYDAVHYDIDLDLTPSANTIEAVTTMTAIATDDLDRFNLDFHGLNVKEVSVDGTEAEFSRRGDEMVIHPAASISTGTRFSVSVSYSGTPRAIPDPGVPFDTVGWQSTDGVIYTSNQPSGAKTWYPSNNHPTDKATFTFRITVPDNVVAAATGILVEEASANGQTTTTWEMDDPMATYLAAVYVGDFERHEQRLNSGVLIRDYVPRGSDPSIREALAITPEAMSFLEEILGPYPFEAYGTIVVPFPLGFALENQTLSVHGPSLLQPEIIAHELAHQWMGNSVTVDDWNQIWLHEGFATYLGLMFDAGLSGQSIESVMAYWRRQLAFSGTSPPGDIEIYELFDFNTVYLRGALTLHALRTQVGDAVFFDILRTHYDHTAGGTTNTEIFLGIVDDLAGPDAVSVVESWLYEPEMPGIESGPSL